MWIYKKQYDIIYVVVSMKLRLFIISLSLIVLGLLTLSLYSILRPQSIPVLAYHDIKLKDEMTDEDWATGFVIPVELFEKQMKYLKDNNYVTLTMDEFYCWMKKECKVPRKSVVITFDDGCRGVYDYVLPIIKKYEIKATAFVITSRIRPQNEVSANYNFLTEEMIRESRRIYSGLEFHSHSHNLHRSIGQEAAVHILNDEELDKDVIKATEILDTNIISYPFGASNERFVTILKENNYIMGFRYGKPFVRARQTDDIFNIPRVTIAGDLNFTRYKIALWHGLFSKNNLLGR